MNTPFNLLFLSPGNSLRSIVAEAIANDPKIARGMLSARSGGSRPQATPHRLALETLRVNGIATFDLRSKSWHEFTTPDAVPLDFVITVCDTATAAQQPRWPGRPTVVHWAVEDPLTAADEADQRKACQGAFLLLKGRISRFVALPFEALDRAQLTQQAEQIGIAF